MDYIRANIIQISINFNYVIGYSKHRVDDDKLKTIFYYVFYFAKNNIYDIIAIFDMIDNEIGPIVLQPIKNVSTRYINERNDNIRYIEILKQSIDYDNNIELLNYCNYIDEILQTSINNIIDDYMYILRYHKIINLSHVNIKLFIFLTQVIEDNNCIDLSINVNNDVIYWKLYE